MAEKKVGVELEQELGCMQFSLSEKCPCVSQLLKTNSNIKGRREPHLLRVRPFIEKMRMVVAFLS